MLQKSKAPLDFDKDIAKFTNRQMEVCQAIDEFYKYILYGGALGGGKDLDVKTPIPTPTGWTTMAEIKTGDALYDDKGNICHVVNATDILHNNNEYKVVFSDGTEIIAGGSHEWVTETDRDRKLSHKRSPEYRELRKLNRPKCGTGKRPDLAKRNSLQNKELLSPPIPTIKTTKEISKTLRDGLQINHAVFVAAPLYADMVDLPIEPYVLGAWLGDGTSVSGNITGIDDEIFNYIREYGYEVTQHANIYSHCVIGLKLKLVKLDLMKNKHIPQAYLRSSIEQRIALLQGLMDTDGTCDSRGQCEIQLTNRGLIEGVYELICSLGIKVQMRTGRSNLYGKDCGEKYRLKFLTDLPVFRIKRKLERQKRQGFRGTHNRRYILSVEKIEATPTRCIEVDSPSRLYLASKAMIPTHNSYLLRWLSVRILMRVFAKYKIKKAMVMLACEDYPTLKDRQISKIESEFPEWLGKYHDDHKIYGKCYILSAEYGSGVICLRNLDDPSKYQSAEFLAIFVDELTKNNIKTFTDLRMRLRWKGIPDKECVFVGATNPGGIGHNYCKAYWVSKIYPPEFCAPTDYRPMFKFIPSKAEDNPHLDSSYWNMLQTLPEHLRAAFRDGSWDIFEGQAFTFMRETHVTQALPIPSHAQIYTTFDWGFGAPFSWGWWWVDGDGRGYRFSEWYGWNGTPNQGLRWEDSRVADEIVKRELELSARYKIDFSRAIRLAGPDCFQKKPDYKGGGQGPSTAEVFASRSLYLSHGDATREVKIRQFRERLKVPMLNGKQSGLPMLMVYEECDQFIRTIPDIVVNPTKPEEIDLKCEDHIYDEACHICMARPIALRAPASPINTAQSHIAMTERVTHDTFEQAAIDNAREEEVFWNQQANPEGRAYSDIDGR
jgi:hypothetical protein